jgi:alkanesulfonate monooxygenase SsuD/methylene tetrahydromethanopterin reductase-like flavin-dependent oxidoreductase (luciferase family)
VGRLEEALPAIQQLLSGNHASLDGRWLRLNDASIAASGAAPPVWIASEGPRMLALTATADGWNHSYWGGDDPTRFKTALEGLHQALDRAGRRHGEVATSASIACVIDGWTEIAGGFREPELAVGPAERLAEVVRDYARAGAQHVILSLSPDPYAEIDAQALEKAGKILELV